MSYNEETYHLSDELRAFEHLNRKITYLLSIIILTFGFGMITYPDEFNFWKDALSYLGNIYPIDGRSNTIGFLILLSGMLASGYICFSISNDLKGYHGYYHFKLAGLGFILLAVPSDLINIVHTLGGVLAVGSLWLFCVLALKELFKKISRKKVLLYHLILQGTVLPYAILYFAGVPVRQAAQKFAVLGLIIILKLVISEYYQMLGKEKLSS
jgi:hypothetical protein